MNGRTIGTMTTASGRVLELKRPLPSQITLTDIARGLANTCRFSGQLRRGVYLSVAQHSLIVAFLVPPAHRFDALLHDASEAYLGDLAHPLKHLPSMRGYRAIEYRLMRAIAAKLGCASSKSRIIDDADYRAMTYEADLWKVPRPSWARRYKGTKVPEWLWVPISPDLAENLFIDFFVKWGQLHQLRHRIHR